MHENKDIFFFKVLMKIWYFKILDLYFYGIKIQTNIKQNY
jgi:hypothetical protein